MNKLISLLLESRQKLQQDDQKAELKGH
ncbi:hypothetical protein LINPERPRIM_LOCUS41166 [Linum perenne]